MKFQEHHHVRLNAVIGGHAAGDWQLPESAQRLIGACDTLDQYRPADAVEDAREQLAVELERAAFGDTPMPDGRVLVDAQREREAAAELQVVVGEVRVRLERQLAAELNNGADDVIAKCLRPVHDAQISIVERFVSAAEKEGIPLDGVSDAALLRASKAAQTAWLALGDVVPRLNAVRRARAALVEGRVEHDVQARFAAYRNVARVLTPAQLSGNARLPWDGLAVRAKLVYDVRHLAPWCPTAREQDDEWRKVYGATDEERRRSHEYATAVRGGGVFVPTPTGNAA